MPTREAALLGALIATGSACGAACGAEATGVRHDRERPGLPLKHLAQWMGARGYEEDPGGRVTFDLRARRIELHVGGDVAVVGGRSLQLGAPVFKADELVYLPLRAVGPVFLAEASWNADTGEAVLSRTNGRLVQRLVFTEHGRRLEDPAAPRRSLCGAADMPGIKKRLETEPDVARAVIDDANKAKRILEEVEGRIDPARLMRSMEAALGECYAKRAGRSGSRGEPQKDIPSDEDDLFRGRLAMATIELAENRSASTSRPASSPGPPAIACTARRSSPP